jgi:inosine-uridine nucleoside N-ribohydrolase
MDRKWNFGLFLLLVLLISLPAFGASAIPIIFDTDMGNDIDDALALAVIHALESRGECELIGLTLSKEHELGPPFVDALNTFYGRGSIPIGMVRGGKGRKESSYLESLVSKDSSGNFIYPHDLITGSQAEDGVKLLRQLLATAEDRSIVFIQVGFSTNLANLLKSRPDTISPQSGIELVRQKVRFLSAMAGNFVRATPEFNVVVDRDSAAALCNEWPTEIIFSGFEIGLSIPYPAVSIENDFKYVKNHPVVEAYRAYSKMPYNRPTWDLTSVLYAVRPDRDYFGLSAPGLVKVNEKGVTTFQENSSGKHRYLTFSEEQRAKTLEALIQLTSQPGCR